MIYWIFGNAGAGKTTLAKLLLSDPDLLQTGKWVHIDGDHIRDIFENKDYSREGRLKNCNLAMQMASFLQDQDVNVIVTLITPYRETRDKIRALLPGATLIELTYDHSSGRRDPVRIASDYESITEDELIFATINTSLTSIPEMVYTAKKPLVAALQN